LGHDQDYGKQHERFSDCVFSFHVPSLLHERVLPLVFS
jgi:hypothetical protein